MADVAPFRANFTVVGTMRGGTTTLAHYLWQHPDVCLSTKKETHFFDAEPVPGEAWEPDYDDYHAYFAHYEGQRAIGEATPYYMYAPYVAERLHAYNPALKLVFLLRHPADRAYSNYWMPGAVHRARRFKSFGEVLRIEEDLYLGANAREEWDVHRRFYSLIDRGFYLKQITNMLRYFPREQMLFVRSEHLYRQHRETLQGLYAFLGVDAGCLPAPEHRHKSEYPPMSPVDRAYLLDVYAREIDELEPFLGWDLSDWRR